MMLHDRRLFETWNDIKVAQRYAQQNLKMHEGLARYSVLLPPLSFPLPPLVSCWLVACRDVWSVRLISSLPSPLNWASLVSKPFND